MERHRLEIRGVRKAGRLRSQKGLARKRRPGLRGSEEAKTGGRKPGRPRSQQAHGAILDAAIALIREVGYDAVAMDAIAERAGVGKATVYRWWDNKELLVAEAIQRIMSGVQIPDTGTTRGDLMALMRSGLAMYRDPATLALLSGLVAAMARSEPIAHAVRNGFVATRRDTLREVLRRGIARGDLRRGTDLDLAMDLLSGPMFLRALVTGAPVDERLTRRLVNLVLRGFAPRSRASPVAGARKR